MSDLIAEDGTQRRHRQSLQKLLTTTHGQVRIASAYVTDTDLLSSVKNRRVQLLTSLTSLDIISNASSLSSLDSLIRSGVQCRYVSHGPTLHAKVYIFGDKTAVVTSANLTNNGLDSNIEVGVQLGGLAVRELSDWFDTCWTKGRPLDVDQIAEWERLTAALREDYAALRKKARQELRLPNEALPSRQVPAEELRSLFNEAARFFFCNTDRIQGTKNQSRYLLEEEMHRRGYAAAWEPFNYPHHMDDVDHGDAIFMFAKGVGIIGIGRASGRRQVLKPSDQNRIRNFAEKIEKTPEWRVPVDWLDWQPDDEACRRKGLLGTFLNVTGDRHNELREAVRKHFLGE